MLTLITIAVAAFIPSITIDTDPENMLPDDNPQRVFHNEVKETFAMWKLPSKWHTSNPEMAQ
ncbi:hypothetical protein NJR55_01045 [Idiomarina sp. M1R2S28]|uniref:Uncharacterized protein n=1 Tax=Idiomarina rhizosphaerae TaxID=2961572 RepID=A0A9X2FYS7_9GAMM|nr:hypothetical protein [Idiomarina rhizosphaerae]MCP1338166.1 hypothetical protein [Idiomarina rhizosphaerae]